MAITEAASNERISRRLAARRAELLALLAASSRSGSAADGDRLHEVVDFMDVAADDSRAVVDEAASGQARRELASIAAALQRLREGNYGECQDCGEAIDELRLLALPAAALCAPCQSIHERATSPALRHRAVPAPVTPSSGARSAAGSRPAAPRA